MKKLFCLIFLSFLGTFSIVYAQIASMSFNPNKAALAPLGWKKVSNINLQFSQEDFVPSDGESDMQQTSRTASLGYAGEEIIFVTTMGNFEQTLTNDTVYTLSISKLNVKLGANIQERISLGLSYEKQIFDSGSNTTNTGTHQEVMILGLGMSIKLFDRIYLGATGQYYKIAPSSGATQYVGLNYTNTTVGLGYVSGKPGETRFRVELTSLSSPEKKADAEGGRIERTQNERQTNQLITGFQSNTGMFIELLLEQTDLKNSNSTTETKVNVNRIDLGTSDKEGMVLAIQMGNQKIKQSNTSNPTTSKFYGVTLGMNF
ncbi:MAG: hypothetical protein COB67_11900 [SAR324 cluster bacterium]|uniref:DUF481 domain-containing protein n=1 Tax=SAR324 cluster bacterium TaxID=2024889 RepID=A0A2A4SSF9_9DELT|nr:MAG: hypothetical protein COB67_11900 [SAR324 cluster bacterium]